MIYSSSRAAGLHSKILSLDLSVSPLLLAADLDT